ncbi:MAG: E3 binding domain-containing protein, partial [Simkaniaceae bacterium]|nr:E3 binding domain-containing protein [Simkaniaceae bacterium]
MSDIEILLPKLGESITSATVVQWFKKEGDAIAEDEPLLEVTTDKVNSEIPSTVNGVLKKIVAGPDVQLDVGEPLAIIATDGSVAVQAEKKVERVVEETGDDQSDYYSPAVLRLAREKGVPMNELDKMKGTGSGGRITKKDIENYAPCPLKKAQPGTERVKMDGRRKAIADNIVKSFYEAPHASLVIEVDIT